MSLQALPSREREHPGERGQNSQVARQNHLISAKRRLRSARVADRRSPHTQTHLGARQCSEPKRPGRAHGKLRFSGLSRGRDRRRPQATAGDHRRPQATAGEQARAQQKTSRLDYTALKRHPALSQRLGASRTNEWRRWAEASGDRAKAAQRSAGRMTGAMATSRFTPPGATAPTQSNNAARRGAASGAARAAGPHNKPRASHPEKARRVLTGRGGTTHQLRPAVRHQHCRALATINRAGSARANASRDPARLMSPPGNRCSPLSGA